MTRGCHLHIQFRNLCCLIVPGYVYLCLIMFVYVSPMQYRLTAPPRPENRVTLAHDLHDQNQRIMFVYPWLSITIFAIIGSQT